MKRIQPQRLNVGGRKLKIKSNLFRKLEELLQKGVCGLTLPQTMMPFTENGITPAIIMNPHKILCECSGNRVLVV
jgi:hypothetical protein